MELAKFVGEYLYGVEGVVRKISKTDIEASTDVLCGAWRKDGAGLCRGKRGQQIRNEVLHN